MPAVLNFSDCGWWLVAIFEKFEIMPAQFKPFGEEILMVKILISFAAIALGGFAQAGTLSNRMIEAAQIVRLTPLRVKLYSPNAIREVMIQGNLGEESRALQQYILNDQTAVGSLSLNALAARSALLSQFSLEDVTVAIGAKFNLPVLTLEQVFFLYAEIDKALNLSPLENPQEGKLRIFSKAAERRSRIDSLMGSLRR